MIRIVPDKIPLASKPAIASEKRIGSWVLFISGTLLIGLIYSIYSGGWDNIIWLQWLVGFSVIVLFFVGIGLRSDKSEPDFFKIN